MLYSIKFMSQCESYEIAALFLSHKDELTEVVELALRVRDGIGRIEPFIEEATRSVCPACRKVCCVGKNSYYSYEDLIYALALGLRMEKREERDDFCKFLGARGCTIERALRPSGCNWYFCDALYEYMEKAPGYARFDDSLREVTADWTEMLQEFLVRLLAIKGLTVPNLTGDCSLFLSV